MGFQGFMGMPMDESVFADMQKENPWFQAGNMFGAMFGGAQPLDLSKKKDGEELSNVELAQVIFAKIFASYDYAQNLDEAEEICIGMLAKLDKVKPDKEQKRDNDNWMSWQNQYGQFQIQLGTVYTYKKEPIKATYHFMLGLKSEMVNLNMPYCDFIRYVVDKLATLPKSNAMYVGCGFTKEKPMGCMPGTKIMLDAQIAMNMIPEMEGNNGEVIVARKGNITFYGHLQRLGSVDGGIDIYETWIIDKDYNLKSIKFYFNGYRSIAVPIQVVRVASGFSIKPHSVLHNTFDFISE